MKTIEELQLAVDEIKEVCNNHGIILYGISNSQGIFAEIGICDASIDAGYSSVPSRIDNVVHLKDATQGYTLAIGDAVE